MTGRTDTERLEWIAGCGMFNSVSHVDGFWWIQIGVVFSEPKEISGDNFREAIDAAMDAEERG